MFNVVKKVGSKEKLVKSFDSIEEASEYVSEINSKNYVSATKVGRQWGAVGVWDITKASPRVLSRLTNGTQKTLYNPVNESKYFVQYSREVLNKMNGVTPEVIPFPVVTDVIDETQLPEAA